MKKRQNVVSLTVHKNTLAKRRGRNNADLIASIAKDERREGDCAGFVIVTWNGDGAYACNIHAPVGSPIGLNGLPGFVEGAVSREIGKIDNRH
jgi:hypothetical protein